jgi:hypothetical protein
MKAFPETTIKARLSCSGRDNRSAINWVFAGKLNRYIDPSKRARAHRCRRPESWSASGSRQRLAVKTQPIAVEHAFDVGLGITAGAQDTF